MSEVAESASEPLRPTYETPEDLGNEDAVAATLERIWKGYEVRKLRSYDKIDRAVVPRGSKHPRALVEIKCRTVTMQQYDTYLISFDKVRDALGFYAQTGIPVFFVVRWLDALGYYKIDQPSLDEDIKLGIGGRTDRDDPNDVELCAFIPINRFEVLLPKAEKPEQRDE